MNWPYAVYRLAVLALAGFLVWVTGSLLALLALAALNAPEDLGRRGRG